MSIKSRLQKLESSNVVVDSTVKDIILVNFVGKDDIGAQINHIWYGDEHFYIADGETEDEFKDRASAAIRKSQQCNPNSVLLMFGKRSSNTESLEH